jgi:hypothetical protein
MLRKCIQVQLFHEDWDSWIFVIALECDLTVVEIGMTLNFVKILNDFRNKTSRTMKESIKEIKVGYPWCTLFVLINSFSERLA